MKKMTADEIDAFLAPTRIAVLGTTYADGAAALTPVWYLWSGGAFNMIMPCTARYAKNLLRDPRATVCVQDERMPYKAVVARGPATVTAEGALDMLTSLAVRYWGDVEGRRYAEAVWADHGEDERVVRIVPERLASCDFNEG